MERKDDRIVRGVVIGGIRKWFGRDEVALKIVDARVKHSRAVVNVVYVGKATRAEVAAAVAHTIATSIPRSYRLRKLSYVKISVSKTGSSRSAKFLMNLRVPRSSYVALASIVRCLRKLGISVRRWVVRNPSNEARLRISASYGLPEVDEGSVRECLEKALSGLNPSRRVCVELELRTRLKELSLCRCAEPRI